MGIGKLFLQSLNASLPVIIFTLLGFALSYGLLSAPKYGHITNLIFRLTMPISIVYTLGRQSLEGQDFLLIVSYLLMFLTMCIVCIPQSLLFSKRLAGYTHTIMFISVNNCVFSGIPTCSGLYEESSCQKYGYIIMLTTNMFILPVSFTLFEMSVNKSDSLKKGALVWKSLKKALGQPLVFSVFLGLLYCIIQQFGVNSLANLPLYLADMFVQFGNFSSTVAMIALGLFLQMQLKNFRNNRMPRKEVVSFIISIVHRHIVAPVLLAVYCKLLHVSYEKTEVASILFSGPTAIMSFAISDQYNASALAAGLDASFGVLLGIPTIPVIQIVCRKLYGVK